MSSESQSTRSSSGQLHIPIAVLAFALAIFFAVQLRSTAKQSEIMRWQLDNLGKQTENLTKAQEQFTATLAQSAAPVDQAKKIQDQYMSLFNDLIDLAKDDKDAKEVVDKWGIKRNEKPKEAAKPAAEEAKEP